MSVYLIADIKVTDGKWIPAYAASVHDLAHKHGGKYLAQRQREDVGRQTAGYHPHRAFGVSIGGSRHGLRNRSKIRALRRVSCRS